jgi:hypothetical protein
MIVSAYYKDGTANINVPNGSLVYDGTSFVAPNKAKTIALIYTSESIANRPGPYPIERFLSPDNTLTWTNLWVCTVIGVLNQANQNPVDVVTRPAPAGGMCICGITCDGINVQGILVSTTEGTPIEQV